MASAIPTALDTFAIDKTDTTVAATDHPTTHNNLGDAVNKLERELRVAATFVVASSTSRRKVWADYVCDGTADDVELNAALAALPSGGGKILLLEGTFNLAASLNFPLKPVTLVGMGAGATVLAPVSTVPAITITGATASGQWTKLGSLLADFRIDGSGSSGSGAHGLYVTGAALDVNYWNLDITGTKGHAVYTASAVGGERPAYHRFFGCNLESGARDGFHFGDPFPAGTYAEHNEVYGCTISFFTGDGLYCVGNSYRASDVEIDACAVDLHVIGGAQCSFHGITCDRSKTNGVLLDAQHNSSFTNCFVADHMLTDNSTIVSPASGRAFSQINGSSGNTFAGCKTITTGGATAPGTGWAYAFGEDSGCGLPANFGPNGYLGCSFGYLANQFDGAWPVLVSQPRDPTLPGAGKGVTTTGTASIAATATSVAVTHGLGYTPARVLLSPTADTQGARWWVSARSSTTFTITLNTAAVTDPITFDWRCQAGEG